VYVVAAFPHDTVARESMPVLEEIRNLLQAHPNILKLEIQGHTHDSGDLSKKVASTQANAELVLQTLVRLGVAPEKLVAKGYGYKKPIADNRSADGRRANHRIVFEVLEWAK
jgi:OmpA-OmpF porin, OOP family